MRFIQSLAKHQVVFDSGRMAWVVTNHKCRKFTALPMCHNIEKIILDCPGLRRTRRIQDHQVQNLASFLHTYLLQGCSSRKFTKSNARFRRRKGSFYRWKLERVRLSNGGDKKHSWLILGLNSTFLLCHTTCYDIFKTVWGETIIFCIYRSLNFEKTESDCSAYKWCIECNDYFRDFVRAYRRQIDGHTLLVIRVRSHLNDT